MEEAQEMVAVKRAYAEIILNTAKEAAARVMSSERKALRFQQDLLSTRDEALRMLLRLKQMIDSKTTEAELTSLSQQRKIEELDAQLNEAEGIITDLRLELKQVQDRLEKMKNERVQTFNEPRMEQVACFAENATLKDKINTIISPCKDSGPETISTSDTKRMTLNQKIQDDKCCNALSISRVENHGAENSGFSSIIMRNKELELYRNGCTQRIRAIGRNLLDENLLGDVGNQDSCIKHGLIVTAADKDDGKCTISSCTKIMETKKLSGELRRPVKARSSRRRKCRFGKDKATSSKSFMKKSSEFEPKLQHSNICHKDDPVKIVQKGKRKRNLKRMIATFRSPLDQVPKLCQPSSFPSSSNMYLDSVSENVISGEDLSRITKDEHKMKSIPCLDPVWTTIKSDAGLISGVLEIPVTTLTLNECELVCSAADNKGRKLIDELVSEKEEGDSAEGSKVANLESNGQLFDVPLMDSDFSDLKTSIATNGSLSQTRNNRILKYTFTRKRKKDMSNPDKKSSPEKSSAKRRAPIEKQEVLSEPQKSNLVNESPRDSRRLAQVARQLVSLSEKRWWL